MTDFAATFSGSSIIPMRESRKIQTRRLAWKETPAPTGPTVCNDWRWTMKVGVMEKPTIWQKAKPGDRIWVKETWGISQRGDARPSGHPYDPEILYRATDDPPSGYEADNQFEPFRWRSPRFMFRKHSRMTLVVTAVRIERLNEISEADAKAEGVVWSPSWAGYVVPGVEHPAKDFPVLSRTSAREMFAALWDTLHGSGAWLKNPEVVILEFRCIQKNIDQMGAAHC